MLTCTASDMQQHALCLCQEQERQLDGHIEALSSALRAMGAATGNKERLLVTDDDITALPCFANHTLFAVKVGTAGGLTVTRLVCTLRDELTAVGSMHHTPALCHVAGPPRHNPGGP